MRARRSRRRARDHSIEEGQTVAWHMMQQGVGELGMDIRMLGTTLGSRGGEADRDLGDGGEGIEYVVGGEEVKPTRAHIAGASTLLKRPLIQKQISQHCLLRQRRSNLPRRNPPVKQTNLFHQRSEGAAGLMRFKRQKNPREDDLLICILKCLLFWHNMPDFGKGARAWSFYMHSADYGSAWTTCVIIRYPHKICKDRLTAFVRILARFASLSQNVVEIVQIERLAKRTKYGDHSCFTNVLFL